MKVLFFLFLFLTINIYSSNLSFGIKAEGSKSILKSDFTDKFFGIGFGGEIYYNFSNYLSINTGIDINANINIDLNEWHLSEQIENFLSLQIPCTININLLRFLNISGGIYYDYIIDYSLARAKYMNNENLNIPGKINKSNLGMSAKVGGKYNSYSLNFVYSRNFYSIYDNYDLYFSKFSVELIWKF